MCLCSAIASAARLFCSSQLLGTLNSMVACLKRSLAVSSRYLYVCGSVCAGLVTRCKSRRMFDCCCATSRVIRCTGSAQWL